MVAARHSCQVSSKASSWASVALPHWSIMHQSEPRGAMLSLPDRIALVRHRDDIRGGFECQRLVSRRSSSSTTNR